MWYTMGRQDKTERKEEMDIPKETPGEAAIRMRELISNVEKRIGTEYVYVYSYAHGKMILVKRGSAADKGNCGIPPASYLYVRRFFQFCLNGPETFAEGVLWGLLSFVTIPIMFFGTLFLGIKEMFTPSAGNTYVVDGGGYEGNGLFDEVSTRRREDLQYLFGIGKYSKENW